MPLLTTEQKESIYIGYTLWVVGLISKDSFLAGVGQIAGEYTNEKRAEIMDFIRAKNSELKSNSTPLVPVSATIH